MKSDLNNNDISRRTFLKRSTVLAIAATNTVMLTGLVKADEPAAYSPIDISGHCNVIVDPILDMDGVKIGLECYWQLQEPDCNGARVSYVCYSRKKDAFGEPVVEDGMPVYVKKYAVCPFNEGKSKAVICDRNWDPEMDGGKVVPY